jgi:hypothetical protein
MSDETTDETTDEAESKPTLSAAIQDLDGFAICAIEDHWGRDLGELTGTKLTMSVLWARKRAQGMKPADAWQAVKRMTLREMDEAFSPEPEADEDSDEDEESQQDVGKGDSVTRGPARSSRSGRGSHRKRTPA